MTGAEDRTARLWDVATGKQLRFMKHPDWVLSLALHPDSKTILTGCLDYQARLFEADTGEPIGLPLQHWGPVWRVAFNRDGKTMLTGSINRARLWDVDTRQQLGSILQHLPNSVVDVGFGADNNTLLTAGIDKTVRIWDSAKGRQLKVSIKPDHSLYSAVFSRDGNTLLTGGGYRKIGEAQLWETSKYKEVLKTPSQEGVVRRVAFSSNGNTFLTGSIDSTARLWESKSGKLLWESATGKLITLCLRRVLRTDQAQDDNDGPHSTIFHFSFANNIR